jgi:PilZ domain
MTFSMPERRRSRRATFEERSWLTLQATCPVQLVDVSLGGMAFSSPRDLDVGRTMAVRATLGREAFNGQIRVRWTRSRPAASTRTPLVIGAAFLPLDETSRRALESFLKLPSPERA